MMEIEEGRLNYVINFFSKYLSEHYIYVHKKDAITSSMIYDEKGFYVLVFLIFGALFRHNYKKLPSIIKLCVVAKYASILEYTKSLLIIGAKKLRYTNNKAK